MRVIDGKFGVRDSKIVNLVSGAEIPEDEPLFLLRARDHHAYETLMHYLRLCASDCNDLHQEGIKQVIRKFIAFANDHPERMKQPGVTRDLKLEDAPAVVIKLPLNDGTSYDITTEDVHKWLELYPGVDVMQQLRNMAGWLDGNPRNRKTRGGIRAFITRWLGEEQNKAPSRPNAGAGTHPASPKPAWKLPALSNEQLAQKIWRDTMLGLQQVISPHSFDSWLKPLLDGAAGMRDNHLYVKVPIAEFLCVQDKFGDVIMSLLPAEISGVKFIAPEEPR